MALEKNIKLKVTSETKQAEQGFDGLDVSVKDLQERIGYLNTEMKKLESNFGKSGLASKEYAMMQREAEIATRQLISMEEKSNQAKEKSIRGLGSLSSASISALGSVSGLGTGVSVLTNSLMSGAGLTASLSGVVIAFSLVSEAIRASREETERFQKAIKDVIDVPLPSGSFKIAPENIDETIAYLKMMRPNTEEMFTMSAGQLSSMTERLNIINNTIKVLEDINKKYKETKSITEELEALGLVYHSDEDEADEKKKDNLSEINRRYKLLSKSVDEYIEKLVKKTEKEIADDELMRKQANKITNSLLVPVKEIKKPGIGFSDAEVMRDFAYENSFYIEQMQAGLMTLQGQFNNFWNKTFGEANSLLEQFLQNFANGLFELGSRSLLSSFLDFIPGGEFLKPFITKPQVINVNLGNETVERVVVGNIRSAQQKRLL